MWVVGLLSGHSGSILPSLLTPRKDHGQACVSIGLIPGLMCPHPSPPPMKIEVPSIPQFHFSLKHQTVILLNTIWRLLASAPHFSQTLINVTGVYSFFLLCHFLQNISALWPADIHLIYWELGSAGEGGHCRPGFKQLTVTKSRQSKREVCRASPKPSPHQSGKRGGRGELGKAPCEMKPAVVFDSLYGPSQTLGTSVTPWCYQSPGSNPSP